MSRLAVDTWRPRRTRPSHAVSQDACTTARIGRALHLFGIGGTSAFPEIPGRTMVRCAGAGGILWHAQAVTRPELEHPSAREMIIRPLPPARVQMVLPPPRPRRRQGRSGLRPPRSSHSFQRAPTSQRDASRVHARSRNPFLLALGRPRPASAIAAASSRQAVATISQI